MSNDAHRSPLRRALALAALLIVLLIPLTAPATAASGAWSRDGDGLWADGDNWDSGDYPQLAADTASFLGTAVSGPRTVTISGAPVDVGALSFSSDHPFTIAADAGGALRLPTGGAAAITVDAANSADHTIAAPIILERSLTVTQDSTATLTLGGTISQSGDDDGLTKAGPGTLVLEGANSYAGTTKINAGTLVLGASGVLGSGKLELNGGALATTLGRVVITNNVDKIENGFSLSGTGTLAFDSSVSMRQNRAINNYATVEIRELTFHAKRLIINGSGELSVGVGTGGSPSGSWLRNQGSGVVNVYGQGSFASIVHNANSGGGTIFVGDTLSVEPRAVTRGVGTLTVYGDGQGIALRAPGSVLDLDLGPESDKLALNHTSADITLADASNPQGARLDLELMPGFAPVAGQSFTLIEHQGTGTGIITGTFAGLPDGGRFLVGELPFIINYSPKTIVVTHQPALSLATSGGGGQEAVVGAEYGETLAVVVRDGAGQPLPEVLVSFAAPAVGPSVSFPDGATALTDVDGVARVRAVAGSVAGTLSVTASTTPAQVAAVSFTLRNLAGAPASVTALGGTGQTAMVNTAFAQPLRARVADAYGNPVPGVMVTLSGPAEEAGATFPAGATAVSDAAGEVAVAVAANGVPGAYTVRATAGELKPAEYALSNTTADVPPPSLSPTSGDLPSGVVSSAYALAWKTTGGASPVVLRVVAGSLPPGLELREDGTLIGQPTLAGVYTFAIEAADRLGRSDTQSYTLTVERMRLGLPVVAR